MHIISTIFKLLLTLVVIMSIIGTVYDERKKVDFIATIWLRFRILMFFEVLMILFQVVFIYAILEYWVPWFRYSWTDLVFNGGGSVIGGPMTEASQSSMGWLRVLPPIFTALLILGAPYLAHAEEKLFRKGHHRWSDIVIQSIKFGLVHCLMGVSLAVGIALIGPGIFFACKYRKMLFKRFNEHNDWNQAEDEAVLASTTYHTLYNTVLIFTALVFTTLRAIG